MQQNDNIWQENLEKYDFNTIFFYRRDMTPWAQKFLITRISDETWSPIYVDNYSIIFVRDSEINKDIIAKYRLPKEIFRVKK